MLIDKTKSNPFGAAVTPNEMAQKPVGIMIDTPQNVPMADDPSIIEQGVGILKDKAINAGVSKATGAATTAAEAALGGAGKGGQAAATSGAMAGKGLMAAAAPMAAPLLIGGLLAAKLFK